MHTKTVTREVKVTVVDADDVRLKCIEMLHSEAAYRSNPKKGAGCLNTAEDDPDRHCLASHLAIAFGSTSPKFREVTSLTFDDSYEPDTDVVEFTASAQALLVDLQTEADDDRVPWQPPLWGIAIARVLLQED